MEKQKIEAVEKKLEKFQSLYGCEIFLTLPEWKRRLFSLRLVHRKNGFPEEVLQELEKRKLKVSLFLAPEKLEGYEKFRTENIAFVPDLSSCKSLTFRQLSDIKRKFENFSGNFCCGAMIGEYAGEELYSLLRKNDFSFAVTSVVSNAASPCLDAFDLKNTSMNGDVPCDVLERFLKSDPYGGVFAHFSLLLTDEITESEFQEKVLPLLDKLQAEEILCMTDEEYCRYNCAVRSLRVSLDSSMAENISFLPLYLISCGKKLLLQAGEKLYIRQKENASPDVENRVFLEKDYDFEIRKADEISLPQRDVSSFADGTIFFPGGCRKALSFSYDDGNLRDPDLIAILDRYGMKGTFNLNSARVLTGIKTSGENWGDVYKGHEVAGHGFFHYSFAAQAPSAVLSYLYGDRLAMETVFHEILCGHAYANGTFSGAVADARKNLAACGYIYARGSVSTMNFDLPDDFLCWEQTCHHNKGIIELADKFLHLDEKEDLKAFTVWGHVSELVRDNAFDMMDEFCRKLSGKEKYIWYATNKEICEYVLAVRSLRYSADGTMVRNESAKSILIAKDGRIEILHAGETLTF